MSICSGLVMAIGNVKQFEEVGTSPRSFCYSTSGQGSDKKCCLSWAAWCMRRSRTLR